MMKSSKEKVHRFVSNDLTVRVAAVDATDVVREMQELHHSLPVATVAVGRAMVGAILMASQLKEKQKVGLLIKGDGPLVSVYAEASYEGEVRGYSVKPSFEPSTYEGGLKIGAAIGKGTLSVARHLPFQKSPHHGTVELSSGEIGEDIAHYMLQSHQVRSIVNLGVYLDTFGKVSAAGGLVVEVMPGVEDEIVQKLQENSDRFKGNISKMILDGAKPIDLVRPYLEGIPFTALDHEPHVHYFCPCTKERVSAALQLLGLEDLDDALQKKEELEIICQMCGRPYKMALQDIQVVRDHLYRESLN